MPVTNRQSQRSIYHEIRNHWRKDACLLEDKTRSRNPQLVGAMAMLRNILLFFFNEQERCTPPFPGSSKRLPPIHQKLIPSSGGFRP